MLRDESSCYGGSIVEKLESFVQGTVCMAKYEGFGGKRALGFLLKSELCQKRSKFRMQFCLRVSNNVLHVFSVKFASFSRYYVGKKPCICCDVST